MFFYIGGVLAGFAIGYLVAQITRKPEKTGYRNAEHQKVKKYCKNCKHLVKIDFAGWITCKKVGHEMAGMPRYCTQYEEVKEETP